MKGRHYAFCKICSTDISIVRGSYAFVNHEKTDKHIKNVWKNSDCKCATHNDNFIIKSRHTVDLKNHASALHALVVVHSGAINSSDMATSKKAIYSTFGSGRTKTTYILQHGLSYSSWRLRSLWVFKFWKSINPIKSYE